MARTLPTFTIGYEGRTLAELVARLKRSRVERVIDVRELPLSRRAGFSKTPLSRALEEAGIGYAHVRSAGNPFRNAPGPHERMLARYRRYLLEHPAVLDEVEAAMADLRCALVCLEADPAECHRTILVERLSRRNRRRRVIEL